MPAHQSGTTGTARERDTHPGLGVPEIMLAGLVAAVTGKEPLGRNRIVDLGKQGGKTTARTAARCQDVVC